MLLTGTHVAGFRQMLVTAFNVDTRMAQLGRHNSPFLYQGHDSTYSRVLT